MTNQLYVHDETSGSRQGLALRRGATVLHDKTGSDIDSSNPLPIKIINAIIVTAYDYVGVTYPSSTASIYTFKTGGVSGSTVAVLTVVVDSQDRLVSASL